MGSAAEAVSPVARGTIGASRMSDQEGPALGWLCPKCGRRVPRRIATCRCGQEQPQPADSAPPSSTPTGPIVFESSAASGATGVLVQAGVGLALLGVVYWLGMR